MGTVVKRPDCAGRDVDWPRCAGLLLVRVERGLHVIPHVRCLTNSRFDLNLNVFHFILTLTPVVSCEPEPSATTTSMFSSISSPAPRE
jgi:hypothetical protein